VGVPHAPGAQSSAGTVTPYCPGVTVLDGAFDGGCMKTPRCNIRDAHRGIRRRRMRDTRRKIEEQERREIARDLLRLVARLVG
jgi:hypothetical protein